MKRIRLTDEVLHDHPELQVRVVVADAVRNASAWAGVNSRMAELETRAQDGRLPALTEDDPRLASWQRAYRAFGTNPRRQRPSMDALRRRCAKQGSLPRINSAVDAYNFVSVFHGIPAGAFDLARLGSCVELRKAVPGDEFTPIGAPDEVEEPAPGEVVYADSGRVLTRHWNHRDAHDTRVAENTTSVVFLLERADSSVPDAACQAAADELAEIVAPNCSAVAGHKLDTHQRDLIVEDGR